MDIASVLLVGCNVDNSVIYANSIGHHDCAMEGQLFAYESHVAVIGLPNPQLAAPAEHVGAAVDLGVHPISFCINALVKLGHSQTWRQWYHVNQMVCRVNLQPPLSHWFQRKITWYLFVGLWGSRRKVFPDPAHLLHLHSCIIIIILILLITNYHLLYTLYHYGWKLLPPRLNFDGSNGCPRNGDPSASQAFFNVSNCFYYYVVGSPICFLCCSYMIFLIAPCVSSSNSWSGLVLFTLVVSISGSPLKTVLHILSWAFSKLRVSNDFPPAF